MGKNPYLLPDASSEMRREEDSCDVGPKSLTGLSQN